MFGDENDYKFQMDVDSANHLGITPEATHTEGDSSLFSQQNGFADIEILASFNKGFPGESENIAAVEPVSDFIAQTDAIQFDSEGHPYVNNTIDASHVAVVDSLPTDIATRFDQDE
tara:strand:+ start:12079 stop:12426 length:348 start_codon:yes stop_codon:yes gene_type:complete